MAPSLGAAQRRPRQTRAHGDARKRQILDAALDLFSARGFNAVSVADLATRVGMTQAGLLHHFPTKADLMLAVLQERETRNSLDEERDLNAGADYVTSFINRLEENEKNPVLVQLFAVLSAESLSVTHPSHEWFVQRYEKTVADMTNAISEMIDEPRLPAGATAETVARWVIGLADGLRLQWLLNPEALSRHQTVRQFVQLLEPYLKDHYRWGTTDGHGSSN